jgi:hypothetical protein
MNVSRKIGSFLALLSERRLLYVSRAGCKSIQRDPAVIGGSAMLMLLITVPIDESVGPEKTGDPSIARGGWQHLGRLTKFRYV